MRLNKTQFKALLAALKFTVRFGTGNKTLTIRRGIVRAPVYKGNAAIEVNLKMVVGDLTTQVPWTGKTFRLLKAMCNTRGQLFLNATPQLVALADEMSIIRLGRETDAEDVAWMPAHTFEQTLEADYEQPLFAVLLDNRLRYYAKLEFNPKSDSWVVIRYSNGGAEARYQLRPDVLITHLLDVTQYGNSNRALSIGLRVSQILRVPAKSVLTVYPTRRPVEWLVVEISGVLSRNPYIPFRLLQVRTPQQ